MADNDNNQLIYVLNERSKAKVRLVFKSLPISGSKKAIFIDFWRKLEQKSVFSAEKDDKKGFLAEFQRIKTIRFDELCLCSDNNDSEFSGLKCKNKSDIMWVKKGERVGPVCVNIIEKEVKETADLLSRVFAGKKENLQEKEENGQFCSILAKNIDIFRFLVDFKMFYYYF